MAILLHQHLRSLNYRLGPPNCKWYDKTVVSILPMLIRLAAEVDHESVYKNPGKFKGRIIPSEIALYLLLRKGS